MKLGLALLLFGAIATLTIAGVLIFEDKTPTGSVILGEPTMNEAFAQDDSLIVTYVYDGDTIKINDVEKVRFICIDTPEVGERGYSEAKIFLTNLLLDEEVELEKDKSDVDRYGRSLRYVYYDGVFVNELLVKEGYAKAYPYGQDTKLCPQIHEAEDYAKTNELGIWAEEEITEETFEETTQETTEETNETEETQTEDSIYICDENYYNCVDFETYEEAKAVFEYCGGLANDIHYLDSDHDNLPCENLMI
jgi:micrococcal nuclease